MLNPNIEFKSTIVLLYCAVILASGISINNPGDPYDYPRSDDVPTQGFLVNSYGSDGYTDKYIYPYGTVENSGYGVVNASSFTSENPSSSTVVTNADHQGKKEKYRVGFYNVQTGDEFFLNDFDVRPKFKTKKDNKHVLGYEYNPNRNIKRKGQVKPQQGNKINKPNNNKLGPNKNRRPQGNKNSTNNRNKNKNNISNTRQKKPTLQNNKKRIRRTTTTRRPIVNNRDKNANTRKKLQQNKRKVQQNLQSPSGCRNPNSSNKRPTRNRVSPNKIKNRVTQNRKPNRKLNKFNSNRKRYQNRFNRRKDDLPVKQQINIPDVVKNYMEKLKQNIDGETQSSSMNRSKQRSLFSMTFNQIRNQSLNFANRFMSLFTVTQHANYRCSADNAFSYYEGTCYTEKQCLKLGGTSVGNCSRYEKCCIFKFTCGESTSQNCTYFESPNYPEYFPKDQNVYDDYTDGEVTTTDDDQNNYEDQPDEEETFTTPYRLEDTTEDNFAVTDNSDEFSEDWNDSQQSSSEIDFTDNILEENRNFNNKYMEYAIARDGNMAENFACTFKVLKLSEGVQQMRIDFVDLELIGPDVNGDCVDEKLMITGDNLNALTPILCGYNSGQHVYIDVPKLVGALQISILSNDVYSKRYKIKISQLESPCAIGMNCLQHYIGTEGSISSFNYDQASILARSDPGYLNNLNYVICIRREMGYCSVTFSNRYAEDDYLFDIRNAIDDSDSDGESDEEFGLGPIDCPNDFVVIDNMRICGQNFQTVTDTTTGPIVMIPVHTNDELTGIGFKLFYKQNRCTN